VGPTCVWGYSAGYEPTNQWADCTYGGRVAEFEADLIRLRTREALAGAGRSYPTRYASSAVAPAAITSYSKVRQSENGGAAAEVLAFAMIQRDRSDVSDVEGVVVACRKKLSARSVDATSVDALPQPQVPKRPRVSRTRPDGRTAAKPGWRHWSRARPAYPPGS